MDTDGLHQLMVTQQGVVARRQLVRLGATDPETARMIRRRDLVRVHRGVYVNHTGPLTPNQREWAAVLVHWPAALARESALPLARDHSPVHVAIDLSRTVTQVQGVVAHRTADLEDRVDWVKSPPRMKIEHATLDVASARREQPLAMFRVLADTCQTRRTSANRLADVLRSREAVPGRLLMLAMLDDLSEGACSVLEREYLHRVERAHALPVGRRQKAVRRGRSSVYRDVDYEDFGVLVELDGRAFHDNATSRDRDAERDLQARASDNQTTVRLTFGLVFGSACRTAERIAVLLRRGGWSGRLMPCPRCVAKLPLGSPHE